MQSNCDPFANARQDLRRAKSFRDTWDTRAAEAFFRDEIKRYETDPTRLPRASGVLRTHLLSRAVGQVDPQRIAETVAWDDWRLGLEYCLLLERVASTRVVAKQDQSPITVSRRVWLALALALTGRNTAASEVADRARPYLTHVQDAVSCKPSDFAVFKLFFQWLDTQNRVDPDFQRPDWIDGEDPLCNAVAARARYSKTMPHQTGFLNFCAEALVPVELVFLNALLRPEVQDSRVTMLGQAIAQTSYPDDDTFQTFDVDLTVLGF